MAQFELRIDFRAEMDLEESLDNYIKKSAKAAHKLHNSIQKAYDSLEINPFFQVRYLDYRCLPVKGFPYMIHFTIDEHKKLVFIHAIINTDKDPKKNWLK